MCHIPKVCCSELVVVGGVTVAVDDTGVVSKVVGSVICCLPVHEKHTIKVCVQTQV